MIGSSGLDDRIHDTIGLLEKCLSLMEENLPRRALGGHWDLNTTCAGITLLKIRAGLETRESAKAVMAKRFLDVYYRYFGPQTESYSTASQLLSTGKESGATTVDNQPLHGNVNPAQASEWLNDNFMEVCAHVLASQYLLGCLTSNSSLNSIPLIQISIWKACGIIGTLCDLNIYSHC